MQVVYKNCDSRRISGPTLLEVTCHKHLDGVCPIGLTVETLYTNAALPCISGDVEMSFITDAAPKILKNAI